jgi:hypothetical protein
LPAIPLSDVIPGWLVDCSALGLADGLVVPDGFVADGFVDAEGLGCAAGGGVVAALVSVTAPLLVLLLGLVLQAAVRPTKTATVA